MDNASTGTTMICLGFANIVLFLNGEVGASVLERLAEFSVALAMVYLVYLIVKQVVSTLPKKDSQFQTHPWASDIAVLKSEMGTLKETVVPLSELVGDVKVLLDAIDDLRARVRDLEQARRREGER